MKLRGVKNDKWFIASVDHHDCVGVDDLMMDGGQIGTDNYAGYTRASGEYCCAEVAQNWAELIYDYRFNDTRQYGIWKLEDVKILNPKEEDSSVDSFEHKLETAYWGTYGKDGKQPFKYILLKDAETDHLKKILETQHHISSLYKELIEYILKTRNEN